MRGELVACALLAACSPQESVREQTVATACGFGTHLEGNTCVPDSTRFELRVPSKIGAADTQPLQTRSRFARQRLVVFGTQPDGAPVTDDLVFSVEPPSAGTFTRATARLGRLGAETFFLPCERQVPGCLGAAKLIVARASDPATPIVTSAIEIVDPVEVSPAKACQTGETKIARLEGNDPLLAGSLVLDDTANWTFPPIIYRELWSATVTPVGQSEAWTFEFNTARQPGHLLVGKVYEDIRRAESAPSDQVVGYPAMYVRRSGFECPSVTGMFHVVEYEVDFATPSPSTKRATFYFEQHCNGDPDTRLSGCVHFHK
jgi:hypothetical protein